MLWPVIGWVNNTWRGSYGYGWLTVNRRSCSTRVIYWSASATRDSPTSSSSERRGGVGLSSSTSARRRRELRLLTLLSSPAFSEVGCCILSLPTYFRADESAMFYGFSIVIGFGYFISIIMMVNSWWCCLWVLAIRRVELYNIFGIEVSWSVLYEFGSLAGDLIKRWFFSCFEIKKEQ